MTAKKEPGRPDRHAPRIPGQQAAIGFAGKGWQRMGPADDAELGRLVRATAFEAGHRTAVRGGRRDKLVLAIVNNRHPGAVAKFGAENIVALLCDLGPGECNWCHARRLHKAASPPKPLPTPTAALAALLGSQCGRCRVAFAAAQVADREHTHVEAVTAAGFRPQAAATLRTAEQVARTAAAVRATEQASRNPTPTGALWPAGKEPAGLTGSARTAANRGRTVDPETCPCRRCETYRRKR